MIPEEVKKIHLTYGDSNPVTAAKLNIQIPEKNP